jgi:hypothetical protein
MMIEHPEKSYYMELALYDNLKPLKKRIEKDSDVLFFVVGKPGDGKDTIAQQVLYFLDNDFNMNSIKWSFEEYVKYSIGLFNQCADCKTKWDDDKCYGRGHHRLSRAKSIMHSEGRESLSGLSLLTKRTRGFMDWLYENRQANMYQAVLVGDFFDLPRAIVNSRGLFMIYVHEEGEFDKGYFKFYAADKMKKLYNKGKKYRDMSASAYDFRGRFNKFYTVGEEVYRKIKGQHLKPKRYIIEEKDSELTQKEWLFWLFDRAPGIKPSIIYNNIPITKRNYFRCKDEWHAQKDEKV